MINDKQNNILNLFNIKIGIHTKHGCLQKTSIWKKAKNIWKKTCIIWVAQPIFEISDRVEIWVKIRCH